jgi:hypothetical protein
VENEIKKYESMTNNTNSSKSFEGKSRQRIKLNSPKKSFNNYTKPYTYFFDPKLQQGGESSIIIPKRNNSKNKKNKSANISKEYTHMRTDSKGRVDFSPEKKVYNYREFPHGWCSLKDFFNSNLNLNQNS